MKWATSHSVDSHRLWLLDLLQSQWGFEWGFIISVTGQHPPKRSYSSISTFEWRRIYCRSVVLHCVVLIPYKVKNWQLSEEFELVAAPCWMNVTVDGETVWSDGSSDAHISESRAALHIHCRCCTWCVLQSFLTSWSCKKCAVKQNIWQLFSLWLNSVIIYFTKWKHTDKKCPSELKHL